MSETLNIDAITTEAAGKGATLAHVNTLAAECRRLRYKLGEWMKRVPEGYEPVEAYRKGDRLVVIGEPLDTGDCDNPHAHNCDEMGCGSWSHVVFSGTVKFSDGHHPDGEVGK